MNTSCNKSLCLLEGLPVQTTEIFWQCPTGESNAGEVRQSENKVTLCVLGVTVTLQEQHCIIIE